MPGTHSGGQGADCIFPIGTPRREAHIGCGKRCTEGRYLRPRNWLLRFLGAKLLHGIVVFLLFLCHEDVFPSKV